MIEIIAFGVIVALVLAGYLFFGRTPGPQPDRGDDPSEQPRPNEHRVRRAGRV